MIILYTDIYAKASPINLIIIRTLHTDFGNVLRQMLWNGDYNTMRKITLSSKGMANMTAVSNTFIDSYMPSANGSYVKVYLYLLRCLGQPFVDISIPHIADKLDNTERDVIRALGYWEKSGLINLVREADEIIGISLNNPECDSSCNLKANNQLPKQVSTSYEQKNSSLGNATSLTVTSNTNDCHKVIDNNQQLPEQPKSIASLISLPLEVLMENNQFADMICAIEANYIKRPLNPRESEFIADLYCKFQFGPSLIFDLFDECSKVINQKNTDFIPYMNKVAITWHSNGVDNSLKAKEYSKEYLECYAALIKAFGINNRSLGSGETRFIKKWHTDQGFSAQMIQLACEKCIGQIGTPSLSYTETILNAWKRNNIKTPDEVAKDDLLHKESEENKKHSPKPAKANFYNTYNQRDYSEEEYSKLELELLSR